jgi:hypothetical protein
MDGTEALPTGTPSIVDGMPKARRLPLDALPPIFSRREALEAGVTDHQLAGRRLTRLGHGWYATDARDRTRWAAALATCRGPAALYGVTALRCYGMPIPWACRNDQTIHVCVPPTADAPQRSGITAHQRMMLPGDIVVVQGLPTTSPARTFLDLAGSLPVEELVGVGDAMLAAQILERDTLHARLTRVSRQRGIRAARIAAAMLDGRAASMPESTLRVRIINDNLPAPEPQCPIPSATTGVIIAYADLGYEHYRVAVEHEGRHHAEPDQFAKDTRRYTDISAADWLIVRSSAQDLANGSRHLLDSLRQTLIHRGWQPPRT